MADAPRRRLRVVAAVVFDGPLLLMTQRPPGGPVGLQWEFPGGKVERGEAPLDALVREIREELGVASTPHETMAVTTHDYAHGTSVEITFVRCTLDTFTFAPSDEVHAVRWQKPEEIRLDEVLEGDRDFLRGLGARDRVE